MSRAGWAAGAAAILALLAAPAPAATFTLRSEVDAHRVGVEDQLVLTVTLEGSNLPVAPPLPPLTNLQVLAGPSQSTQVSIVGSAMTQTRSTTWVLQPRAVGHAQIGEVKAGDQVAPAIPIEVVAGRLRPREERRADPFDADPFADPFEQVFGRSRRRAGPAPKLFMEAVPSRSRLRVGEPLVLTYVLYTQTSVSDLQLGAPPQYTGFWVEELPAPQSPPTGEAARVEGEDYRRFALLRKLLFPTRAGSLTLPAAAFKIGLPRQGFFDTGSVVERSTRPLTIQVDPLPEAPGFSGAVGRFEASAALDREAVALGEAATLRFRVQGTGNLKWVDRGPELQMAGAKVYPPQVKSELRTTTEGIAGSRTWEFVVVPETSGVVEVPPLAFTYLDSRSGRLATVRTEPIALRVEGGTVAADRPVLPATRPQPGTAGGLPLRAGLDPAPAPWLVVPGRVLGGVAILVLFAHGALVALEWLRGLTGRFGSGGERRRSRSARHALRGLERAAGAGMAKEQAAALVERALHEAFGEIAEHDDSERARAVRALLDDVHFVRYAPQLGDYSDTIRELAARGAEVVRRWA